MQTRDHILSMLIREMFDRLRKPFTICILGIDETEFPLKYPPIIIDMSYTLLE